MHISIPTKDLKAALARNKLAIDLRNTAQPVLKNVLVSCDGGGITLTTGQRDDLFASIPVPGVPRDFGKALVPFKDLSAVAALRGSVAVDIFTEDDRVTLRNGKASMNFEHGWKIDDFPVVPAFDGPQFKLTGAQLAEALPAVSTEDTRPLLTGICISKGDLAATDCYRLYVLRTGATIHSDEEDIVLPRELAKALTGFTDITFTVGPKSDNKYDETRYIRAEADGETWVARLIPGAFPPYNQLIPDQPEGWVRFGSEEAIDAITTLEKLVPGSQAAVRISAGDEGLVFTREDSYGKTVTVEVGGSIDTPPWTDAHSEHEGNIVCFNPGFLRELLAGTDATVELRGENGLKPWLLREQVRGGERLRLLMPVRVA